ncbi:hypothetical protein C0993_007500 [Termitomyces sp. T159_Od127]|nr:hypothetical protein C0993_007500 [Termitomyces sp. T159_Od127]
MSTPTADAFLASTSFIMCANLLLAQVQGLGAEVLHNKVEGMMHLWQKWHTMRGGRITWKRDRKLLEWCMARYHNNLGAEWLVSGSADHGGSVYWANTLREDHRVHRRRAPGGARGIGDQSGAGEVYGGGPVVPGPELRPGFQWWVAALGLGVRPGGRTGQGKIKTCHAVRRSCTGNAETHSGGAVRREQERGVACGGWQQ